jgi:tRNA(fMet)-specific endonuclease VapC
MTLRLEGGVTRLSATPRRKTVPVLPFHEAAAHTYAELRAHLEHHGSPLAEPDLRIAAIARTFDLVLVTGNERHFRRIPGLVVENWIEPA